MPDKCWKCGNPASAIVLGEYVCDLCYNIRDPAKPPPPPDIKTLTNRIMVECRAEIERARTIHPKPRFTALIEEIGEVATDLEERRNPRDELIQVACVALRLAIEPWEHR